MRGRFLTGLFFDYAVLQTAATLAGALDGAKVGSVLEGAHGCWKSIEKIEKEDLGFLERTTVLGRETLKGGIKGAARGALIGSVALTPPLWPAAIAYNYHLKKEKAPSDSLDNEPKKDKITPFI